MKQRITAFYNNLVDSALNQTRLDALKQDVRDMQAIADPVERALKINQALRNKSLSSDAAGGLINSKADKALSKILNPLAVGGLLLIAASPFISLPALVVLPSYMLLGSAFFGTYKFISDISARFEAHYDTLKKEVSAISNSHDIENLQKSPHFAAAVKEFPSVKYAFGQYAGKRAIEALEQQTAPAPGVAAAANTL